MTHKPLLSICIPTYNGAKYIRDNLDVIVAQVIADRLDNVEVVVSDNCSTDETPTIIAEYVKKHSFIRYSRNDKNILFNGNMLKCCELAEGEFIHFMGDDDFYQPNGIKRIVDVIKNQSHDIIMVSNNWLISGNIQSRNQNDYEIFGNDLVFDDKNKFIQAMYYRMWCVSDIVVRTSLTKNIKNNLPPVKDWLQIGMILYIALHSKSFYCFSSQNPIITIRLLGQKWLNNNDAPYIYLNNLKTMSYSIKMGYNPSLFKKYKKWFLKLMFYDLTFFRTFSFKKNVLLLIAYLKFYVCNIFFYTKFIKKFLFYNPNKEIIKHDT